jgi:hypothetical protein
MSVTAKKIDDWYLDDIDTAMQIYPVVEGGKSVYYKRENYILTISRKFVQMTAFFEEVGNKRSSFAFMTGGGAQSTYSSTGKKWICTKDHPVINDTITGEGLETQVWEYYADPVKLPESEYKTSGS